MKMTYPQIFKCLQNKLSTCLLFSLLLLNSPFSHATVITDLLITEIMANPSAVSDSKGEWFEIYNPSDEIFNLNGTSLSDAGSNYHLINEPDPLLINPGEYFVFGRNNNELENGGYTPDYVYSNFVLGNTDDEIILTDELGNSLSLAYTSGFTANGHSLELTTPNMTTENYAITTNLIYGAGDYGTPGVAGNTHLPTVTVSEPATFFLVLTGLFVIFGTKKSTKYSTLCSAT